MFSTCYVVTVKVMPVPRVPLKTCLLSCYARMWFMLCAAAACEPVNSGPAPWRERALQAQPSQHFSVGQEDRRRSLVRSMFPDRGTFRLSDLRWRALTWTINLSQRIFAYVDPDPLHGREGPEKAAPEEVLYARVPGRAFSPIRRRSRSAWSPASSPAAQLRTARVRASEDEGSCCCSEGAR